MLKERDQMKLGILLFNSKPSSSFELQFLDSIGQKSTINSRNLHERRYIGRKRNVKNKTIGRSFHKLRENLMFKGLQSHVPGTLATRSSFFDRRRTFSRNRTPTNVHFSYPNQQRNHSKPLLDNKMNREKRKSKNKERRRVVTVQFYFLYPYTTLGSTFPSDVHRTQSLKVTLQITVEKSIKGPSLPLFRTEILSELANPNSFLLCPNS